MPEPEKPSLFARPLELEEIARTCHEVTRAYNLSFGDTSLKPWNEEDEHLKDSVRDGVIHVALNPEVTPEQSHENWMRWRLAAGWIYSVVKDVTKRTHPNLRPYVELSDRQKLKDALFLAVVRAHLDHDAYVKGHGGFRVN